MPPQLSQNSLLVVDIDISSTRPRSTQPIVASANAHVARRSINGACRAATGWILIQDITIASTTEPDDAVVLRKARLACHTAIVGIVDGRTVNTLTFLAGSEGPCANIWRVCRAVAC